jgi:hypothetical protein
VTPGCILVVIHGVALQLLTVAPDLPSDALGNWHDRRYWANGRLKSSWQRRKSHGSSPRGHGLFEDVHGPGDDERGCGQGDSALCGHQSLRLTSQRHRVGGRESGGVGEADVEIVTETGFPVFGSQVVLGHLGEQEIGIGATRGGTSKRAASVQLPIPDAERDDVGQVDRPADANNGPALLPAVPLISLTSSRIALNPLSKEMRNTSSRLRYLPAGV